MTITEYPNIHLKIFREGMRLMGNHFEISVVGETSETAKQHIAAAVAEISRIENLLSTFKETSETNLVNSMAGKQPVTVSAEVFSLIQRCQVISSVTQGAFDISYGSVDKRLWNFDKTMNTLPDAKTAREKVKLINYQNIILDEASSTVFLKNEGMRIGFGGIGKGYAAGRAKRILQDAGVKSGIVNASGDLVAWGLQPDGTPWTVGISNPDKPDMPFSWLNVNEQAVATSGNYEKFVMIDGKKYSHTIDPKTGLPIRGIKSATIIAPDAEIADALTTPVMIMGIEAGLYLIDQMKEIGCILIDDYNKVFTSKNIHLT